MKQVTVKLFLAAISLCWIISCEEEATEPGSYNILVCSKYFETIDTLQIDTLLFYGLKTGSCTKAVSIIKGIYPVVAYTESELQIKAEVHIQGANQNLRLKINENGAMLIE